MPDQVMSPKYKSSRKGAFKQVGSSMVKGPTVTSKNIQPFNRGMKSSKKN